MFQLDVQQDDGTGRHRAMGRAQLHNLCQLVARALQRHLRILYLFCQALCLWVGCLLLPTHARRISYGLRVAGSVGPSAAVLVVLNCQHMLQKYWHAHFATELSVIGQCLSKSWRQAAHHPDKNKV